MDNKDNNKLVSLYDFLGRAAGSDLGKAVAKVAKRNNIHYETRQVANSKYEGEVMLYPEWFLISYFSEDDNI
jgi:hypothetical protein